MTKICQNCQVEFEASRETAKYCSDKCRVAYSRVSVTKEKDVTVKEVSVTDGDKEIRDKLISLFEGEGKSSAEIEEIMKNQEERKGFHGTYFIPARFSKFF